MPLILIPLIAGGAGFLTGVSTSSKIGSALKILGFTLALFFIVQLVRKGI